jgi:hypothetical protein
MSQGLFGLNVGTTGVSRGDGQLSTEFLDFGSRIEGNKEERTTPALKAPPLLGPRRGALAAAFFAVAKIPT